jgi:predicted CopG family antitoxin
LSEKTITIPKQLYDELAELQRVDETLPQVIARLVDHYKDTTGEMNKLLHVLKDDSAEWKQLEQRINKKLSMNDAAIIYQWRLTCKKIAECIPKSGETEQNAPPKP